MVHQSSTSVASERTALECTVRQYGTTAEATTLRVDDSHLHVGSSDAAESVPLDAIAAVSTRRYPRSFASLLSPLLVVGLLAAVAGLAVAGVNRPFGLGLVGSALAVVGALAVRTWTRQPVQVGVILTTADGTDLTFEASDRDVERLARRLGFQ